MSTTPTPTPVISIVDAITSVEQSDSNYQKAVAQTDADQALADAAQKKADDAKSVVDTDKVGQKTAALARNAALNDAIAVFQANLIPVEN